MFSIHALNRYKYSIYLKLVATTPRLDANCTDTPSWKSSSGFYWNDCDSYSNNWCQNRKVRPGKQYMLGKYYNYPEDNCCVCGKDYGP